MLSYKKVILQIPDTSLCAAISIVFKNELHDLMIVTYTAETDELRSGNVIMIPATKVEREAKDVDL